MPPLNRRGLLKLSGVALLGLATGFPPPRGNPYPAVSIGRALLGQVTVYSRPTVYSRGLRLVPRDEVLPLSDEVTGEDTGALRNQWFPTFGGYVATNNMQPVGFRLHRPLAEVPAAGQPLEVSVPFVDASREPAERRPPHYRLYFGTTHWSYSVLSDESGRPWYSLYDDRMDESYFVRAEFMRPVGAEEFAPIAPDVPPERKRIEVDTVGQWLEAYEGERQVFRTRISSGRKFVREDGGVDDFRTPLGEFRIDRKRASRHMAAGDLADDDAYDLPGVPWVSYFAGAVAFHGTYWHNDFGFPRSHGCINLPPAAAKWIFRWSTPHPVPGQRLLEGEGTRVIVR